MVLTVYGLVDGENAYKYATRMWSRRPYVDNDDDHHPVNVNNLLSSYFSKQLFKIHLNNYLLQHTAPSHNYRLAIAVSTQ